MVIVGTVITTYAAIRYDSVSDQPQVLSAVDETNLALKQLLGFTVGYYGSILKVTGNTSYAQSLSKSYMTSGLENIADIKPEWGLSFSVNSLYLHVDWFLPTSSSSGEFSVRYDLAGLGFYNLTYTSHSNLNVQIEAVSGDDARVSVHKEGDEPLTVLARNNFKFYRYIGSEQSWELVAPTLEPLVFANGTYSISVPSGIDTTVGYLVQVEDSRGIVTVASSFSRYASTVNWENGFGEGDYVDNISNVDSSPDKGTHSNFIAQNSTDGTFDTLTEQIVFGASQYNTIGYDNQNSFYGGGTSASSISWQHTTGTGNDRALLVAVDIFNDGGTPTTVTSATYNGITLTQVATAYYSGSLRVRSYVFLLVNPNSGNRIITVNFASSTRSIGGSVTYTNVNQTFPILANNINTGSSTSPSVGGITASGTNSKVFYGHLGTYRTSSDYSVSEGSSQTNRWQAGSYSNSRKGRGSDKSVTSGSVSMSWTTSGTASWAAIAVLLQPTQLYHYELDLEEQWTNVNIANPNQELCIKAGTLGSETLLVDVWHGGTWVSLTSLTGLVDGWKNVSVGQYLSSTLTIRFKGSEESSDSSQTSWAIDAVLLRPQSDLGSLLSQQQDSTITVEWLQNGTLRWLGQNMQLTTEAKPIPPISAKAFHLTQTIDGVDEEVPFQIEDWVSEYRVPLGLTSDTTVFSNRQMIVFLMNRDVSKFTLRWDGSDLAVQTPLASENTHFNDAPSTRTLNNGKLILQFGSSFNPVTSTIVGSGNSSTANFMRINGEDSVYGAELAYVITNGVVRDVVQQEAEWSGGAGISNDCPNLYANIVLTLPAGTSYYTYQLRLMFTDSQRDRTITDISPVRLTSSISTIQTENGTVNNVAAGTGNFYNYAFGSGGWTAHHWSQFISGSSGAGIMFNDAANIRLYAFDSIAGNPTGALRTNSTTQTIELAPVWQSQVFPFKNALDITWRGAVITFDGPSTPIFYLNDGKPAGLWILAEYQPQITVTAET